MSKIKRRGTPSDRMHLLINNFIRARVVFVILKLVFRTFYDFYGLFLLRFALLKHSTFSIAPVKGVFEFLSNRVEMFSLFFSYVIPTQYIETSVDRFSIMILRAPNMTSILLWTVAAVSRMISRRSCSAHAKDCVRLTRNV